MGSLELNPEEIPEGIFGEMSWKNLLKNFWRNHLRNILGWSLKESEERIFGRIHGGISEVMCERFYPKKFLSWQSVDKFLEELMIKFLVESQEEIHNQIVINPGTWILKIPYYAYWWES